MRALISAALLPLLLAGAACHREEPQPAGLTADDQAQLNDAAAMLDANSIDLNAATEVDETETAPALEGNSR